MKVNGATAEFAESLIDATVTAYIAVMGYDKWYSLTEQEQHDVIMILLGDLSKAIDEI